MKNKIGKLDFDSSKIVFDKGLPKDMRNLIIDGLEKGYLKPVFNFKVTNKTFKKTKLYEVRLNKEKYEKPKNTKRR